VAMGSLNVNLLGIIVGTFAALGIGTGVRLVALRNSTDGLKTKRLGSLKVWWVLAVLLSAAVLLGQFGATILFAVASLLAMREFLRLIGTREPIGTLAIGALVSLGFIHYMFIATGHSDAAKRFLPVVGIVLLGAVRAPVCTPQKYIRTTAGIYWGAMLMIYAFSHALFLFEIDETFATSTSQKVSPMVGPAGWFLFLVLLTEMNDIMQAIVGRKFGKTKITPRVSPNKSLEGLAGGVLTSVLLSLLLAPLLTTLTLGRDAMEAIVVCTLAGIAISLAGFLGDINMSAIKRDAGVKDGSAILPGMGGIIDRIDSLTFTAPSFYYFVLLAKQLT